jgi:hypothetical protein
MRDPGVDKYMQELFGMPKWKKTFRSGDQLLTPMEGGRVQKKRGKQLLIFRADPLPLSRRK